MTLGAPHTEPPPTGPPPAFAPVSLGQIGGRPAELVVAAVFFAAAAVYLVIDALLRLDDVFDLFDYGGTRTGLFFLFAVITAVAVGAALLGTAWLIVNADPRGRLLAVVIALAWAVAMIASGYRYLVPGSDDGTSLVLILGMIAVLLGALLTFLPGAHAAFAAHPLSGRAAVPAARLAMFGTALLMVVMGTFLLIATVGRDGKEFANGIVLIVAGLAIGAIAQMLPTRRVELRLAVSALALAVFITSLILGPRFFIIVILLAAVLVVPFILWLVPDARAFYGERPISFDAVTGGLSAGGPRETDVTGRMPTVGTRPAFSRPGPGSQACTSCGAALTEGDRFCASCGAPVVEPAPPAVRVCPSCGREAAADAAFCSGCGTRLGEPAVPEGPRVCSGCGAELDPGSRFCASCGKPAGGVG